MQVGDLVRWVGYRNAIGSPVPYPRTGLILDMTTRGLYGETFIQILWETGNINYLTDMQTIELVSKCVASVKQPLKHDII